jgi:hypothetical protein
MNCNPLKQGYPTFLCQWGTLVLASGSGGSDLNLNSVNQLIFVMVKCGVLFEVRIEFLNNIETSLVFKGLNLNSVNQLIFVMVKCGVLFEVRTAFLNNI